MRHAEPIALSNLDLFSRLYPRLRNTVDPAETFADEIRAAEAEYIEQCERQNFGYDTRVTLPSGLLKTQMVSLYESHLRGGSGREVYDLIIEGEHGTNKCCYCNIRAADTADHYKEKAEHPLLAVCPRNLIPSCSKCNEKQKGVREKFNPFYDDLGGALWLRCTLEWARHKRGMGPDTIPGMRFSVIPGFLPDTALVGRVSATFKAANLSKRWATEYADVIGRIHRKASKLSRQHDRKFIVDEMIQYDWQPPNSPYQVLLKTVRDSDWLRDLKG
ncbi:hypothetical protein [Brachybacterium sp. SW0106-09]|uniref:hypothetical protein n=1 Tax=Brachybacterium sp. SW0106-09 TaxID=1704590 RepID=UPI000A6D42FF|nr:hypothetical protein [Brachybacterium sp. SW0106-09]